MGSLSLQAQADVLRDLCLRLLAEEPAESTEKGGIIGIYYQDRQYFIPFPTGEPCDSAALFEMGATSKLYSMALLDRLVRQGHLRYSDSLHQYLSGPVPACTLGDLAAHRSGLPLFPNNMGPYSSPAGRLQDYPTEALWDFLAKATVVPAQGYQHSHIGYALLQLVMEKATGQPYDQLLKQFVLEPLALKRTFVALPEGLRLEAGHNHAGRAVVQKDYRYFQGALGLRSSAADALHFLVEQLDLPWSAAAYEQQIGAPRGRKFSGGYAWTWFRPKRRYHRVFISSGMAAGHRAYLLMVPQERMAVVVLSRQVADIHDVPLRLLEHLSYGWKKSK